MDLDGRTVVITGASSGIGRALAHDVARRGAFPALLDRDGAAAEQAAEELGAGALALTVDVTDLEALEDACAEVVARRGGIDVLVANAGVAPAVASVVWGDRAAHRRVLEINLDGVWNTVWAGARHVVERRGHIVVISSVAAFLPGPATTSYAASKAAVEALGRGLRIELAPTGTTVGVVHFGVVDTPLIAVFGRDPLAERIEALLPAPARRRVTPEQAAGAIASSIERRAARVVYPGLYWPLYLARGVLGPIADLAGTRVPAMRILMEELRARDCEQAVERETVR